ncbi:MAG: hypothetical protein LAT50_13685 [Ectothiorhodospiraceae bacterium]|nr:hypothetical protein [Ectothiorhodospiraceae bacterium]
MKTEAQLKKMGTEKLAEYAGESLGIVFEDDVSREQMVAEILAAQDNADDEAAQDQQDEAEELSKVEVMPNEKRIRLTIHEAEGPGGDKPLPVSVNGVAISIPRNMEVDVPERYIEALKLCVSTVYEFKKGKDGTDEMVGRQVPRFGMTILGPVE